MERLSWKTCLLNVNLIYFFFMLLFKRIYEIDESHRKKFFFFITIFIVQALTTQILKFYFKIEASVFHKTLLKIYKIPKPRSGSIEFYTSEEKFNYIDEHDYLPGHRIRNHELLFFYGPTGKQVGYFLYQNLKVINLWI